MWLKLSSAPEQTEFAINLYTKAEKFLYLFNQSTLSLKVLKGSLNTLC